MNRVPKLRFKEFSNEWEEKKLGECVNYKKGYAFKADDYIEKGIRIIRVSDLGEYSIKKENGIYISDEKYSFYKEWEIYPNDIIVTTVGSRPPLYSSMVGKIILVPEKFEKSFLNQNNVLLRSKEKFYQKFIYNYFFRKKYVNHIENIARGNANQANITLQDFFEYKINISNLQEQQRIADFLSSVDKKISITEEKLDLFNEYKKGIMQKIFKQELRFKGKNGNDYPEWEEKKLKDLTESISNGISLNQNFDGIGYKVTRIETISSGKINLEKVGYITTDKNIDEYKLNIGDLLFSNINSVEHIGKIAYIDKNYDLYHGMNLLRIVFNKNLCFKYLYYILTERKYKKLFEKLCNKAVSQASINQTELGKIKVYVPCLEEQQKIADFLSIIDTKIEKISDELENLKEFKKGLLQQMFV